MLIKSWRTRGYLPHFIEPGALQHLVFRLADALPDETAPDLAGPGGGARFLALDAVLDAGHGQRLLSNPAVADTVQDALLHFDGDRYRIEAWCVMPTHVHVLALPAPDVALGKVVQAWKSFTAHKVNALLARTGPFWAREYFDRAMRGERHAETAFHYIEANPVNAGLCTAPEDWPWSSAGYRARHGEWRT